MRVNGKAQASFDFLLLVAGGIVIVLAAMFVTQAAIFNTAEAANSSLDSYNSLKNAVVANPSLPDWLGPTAVVPAAMSVIFPANGISYSQTSFALSYSASGAQVCSYSLDAGPNISLLDCGGTTFLAAEGGHTVYVWGRGVAGDWSFASSQFTVDTLPPGVGIGSPSNSTYYSLSGLSLDYSTNGGAAYCTYSLDGGANSTLPDCSGSQVFSVTSYGPHNATVWASDAGGNTASASVWFSTDSVLPSILIDSPTNTTYYTSSPVNLVVHYSVGGAETCRFSVDGGANVSLPNCVASHPFSVTYGFHSVTLWASNAAGKWASATQWFTTEASAPAVAIYSPLNATYYSYYIDLNYSAPSASSCYYSVDGGANSSLASCVGVQTFSVVNYGPHNVRVWAMESGGKWNNSVAWFNITVTPPDLTVFAVEKLFNPIVSNYEYFITYCNNGTAPVTSIFRVMAKNLDTDTTVYSYTPTAGPDGGNCTRMAALPCNREGLDACGVSARLLIKVDTENAIAESNELNNEYVYPPA